MGSKSSSSSSKGSCGILKPNDYCTHDRENWKVIRLCNEKELVYGNGGVIAGRVFAGIFTAGLSEAAYGIAKSARGLKDGLYHCYVDIQYYCKICGNKFWICYEYTNTGLHKSFGYHPNCSRRYIDKNLEYKNLNYYDIERIFDRKRNTYRNDNWSTNNHSCGTFADEFSDTISEN